MEFVIGMLVGVAVGSFPYGIIKIDNKKYIHKIEQDIAEMTKNRCGKVKSEIQEDIKFMYLCGKLNKKTYQRLMLSVSEKYNNMFL